MHGDNQALVLLIVYLGLRHNFKKLEFHQMLQYHPKSCEILVNYLLRIHKITPVTGPASQIEYLIAMLQV